MNTQNLKTLLITVCLAVGSVETAKAQENTSAGQTKPEEIIVKGTKNSGWSKGMDAYLSGDFSTAEIEFERNFRSLKRVERARENAIRDTALGLDRADTFNSAGGTTGSTVSTPNGSAQVQSSAGNAPAFGVAGNYANNARGGGSILTDGKITQKDFAFSKYMSGLSEIKLGKLEEARTSLKSSVKYDGTNFDARMRLGLLYVQKLDFKNAGKQLEALDKLSKKCKKKACDDLKDINSSSVTLATAIIQAAPS